MGRVSSAPTPRSLEGRSSLAVASALPCGPPSAGLVPGNSESSSPGEVLPRVQHEVRAEVRWGRLSGNLGVSRAGPLRPSEQDGASEARGAGAAHLGQVSNMDGLGRGRTQDSIARLNICGAGFAHGSSSLNAHDSMKRSENGACEGRLAC